MRYFLLDRVTEIVEGKSARGIKNITLTDEVLHDHFPDFPIMPGVLILEGVAQLAGFLLEVSFNRAGSPLVRALLIQIDDAKFHETCGPGDQLEMIVKLDSHLETASRIKAEVLKEQKRVVTATMTFVLRPIESDRLHEQRRYIYKLWTKDLKQTISIP